MKNNADQVAKNLWVGGVPADHKEVDGNFDALVLAAREFQDVFPAHKFPGTVVIYAPIPDGKLTNAEKAIALRAAIQVYELNRDGRRVLVTCAQGVNRSALIAALAMIIGGWSARKAVENIRKYRKPVTGSKPLFNPYFVDFLSVLEKAFSTPRSPQDSPKKEDELHTPNSSYAD